MKKNDRKRTWFMSEMSNLVAANGGHPGKIDWNTAIYKYLNGFSTYKAAQAVLRIQKENGELIDENKADGFIKLAGS